MKPPQNLATSRTHGPIYQHRAIVGDKPRPAMNAFQATIASRDERRRREARLDATGRRVGAALLRVAARDRAASSPKLVREMVKRTGDEIRQREDGGPVAKVRRIATPAPTPFLVRPPAPVVGYPPSKSAAAPSNHGIPPANVGLYRGGK